MTLRACFVMLAVSAACSDPSSAPAESSVDTVSVDASNEVAARKVDILFVIDDGPSMLDKYTTLRNNLPNFTYHLEMTQGGTPNMHIGVITPDLGTRGSLDATPGPAIGAGGSGACSGTGKRGELLTHSSIDGRYIIDVELLDGTRKRNYTGTLAQAFSGLASVGTTGCGFEQPLEAAKLALSPQTITNAGFLRPDAKLVIFFIDDEDDCSVARTSFFDPNTATLGPLQSFRCNRFGHICSTGGTDSDQMNQVGPKAGCASNEGSTYLTHVADYVTFFRGLKADPNDVIVAIVGAPSTPYEVELRTPSGGGSPVPAVAHSCAYTGALGVEVGDPAVRLVEFASGFPNRYAFSTICTPDYSPPLVQVTNLLATLWM
jgi:hypothetical protein